MMKTRNKTSSGIENETSELEPGKCSTTTAIHYPLKSLEISATDIVLNFVQLFYSTDLIRVFELRYNG